jgi:hypothetical protein
MALAVMILAGGADAWAQVRMPGMGCEGRFSKLDANGDGKVTFEEFNSVPHPEGKPEWLFGLRDANRDGKLTQQEFCAGKGAKKRAKDKEKAPEPAKSP